MEISQKTAKLAKEYGFDLVVNLCYADGDDVARPFDASPYSKYRNHLEYYSAPTQDKLKKWLRDAHDIHVEVNIEVREFGEFKKFFYSVSHENNNFNGVEEVTDVWFGLGDKDEDVNFHLYDTYEVALEMGLQEGLILIN